MLKKRAAIELSVNFIVIIIISLVVLGMGVYLVNRFVSEASDIKEELDIETEKQIMDLLSSGDRVAFPINKKTIAKGHGEVFGLGIFNILGEEKTFTVDLEQGIFIEKGATESDDTWPSSEPVPVPVPVFIASRSKEIKNNEQVVLSIPVNVPKGTPSGTYVIDVNVKYDTDKEYGTTQKIYVIVT